MDCQNRLVDREALFGTRTTILVQKSKIIKISDNCGATVCRLFGKIGCHVKKSELLQASDTIHPRNVPAFASQAKLTGIKPAVVKVLQSGL